MSRLTLRWTIGRKLTAAFAAVVCLFVVALVVTLAMQAAADRSWGQLQHWQRGQDAIAQSVTGSRIQQSAQALYAATGDVRYRREWQRGVAISNAGSKAADALHDPTIRRIADGAAGADHLHDKIVHQQLFPAIARGDRAAALAALRQADRYVRGPIGAGDRIAGYLTDSRAASIADAHAAADRARTLTIAATILGALLALGVALLITRSLAGRAKRLGIAAQHLAEGDTEHELHVGGTDELSRTARHFQDVVTAQRELSHAAGRVAAGDLTVEVRPRSERDALGHAFAGMVTQLRELASTQQTSASTQQIAAAAQELATTAEELEQLVGRFTLVA